jgi:hypothetical protein
MAKATAVKDTKKAGAADTARAAEKEAGRQTGTAVANTAKTGVGKPIDFLADSGKGKEGTDKSSFAIPFLVILQTNSPACAPKKEGGLGLTPGEFMDSITNETFETLRCIPVAFQRRFIAWAPRSKGGGFKGEFNPAEVENPDNPLKWKMVTEKIDGKDRNLMTLPSGDILKDTRSHYVLYIDKNGHPRRAIFALASTQIKKSKKWMSRIDNLLVTLPGVNGGKPFNPASFSHSYELRTVKEENESGKWYGVDVLDPQPLFDNPDLYAEAKEFHDLVLAGKVEVSVPTPDVGAEAEEEAFQQGSKK